jgi:hypothetical protein
LNSFFETMIYVSQAGLELLGSTGPPALDFQVAGATGYRHVSQTLVLITSCFGAVLGIELRTFFKVRLI